MGHLVEHMGSSVVSFTRMLRFSYVLVRKFMVNMTDVTKKHVTILLELSKLMLLSCHERQIFFCAFNGPSMSASCLPLPSSCLLASLLAS